MKRPNITPGPWIAGCLNDGYHPITTRDAYATIATAPMKWVKGREKANARAIAAVPDLLEVLEQCLLFVTATPHDPAFHDRILSALTKAGYTF